MRAAIHMPVAARASLAPLAPPTRRAALAPLPKTARTLKPSLIAVAPHRLGAAAPIVVARAAPANASTAKIIVTGRHVELTAPLKEYAVSSFVEWGACWSARASERKREREKVHQLKKKDFDGVVSIAAANSSSAQSFFTPSERPRGGAHCFPTSSVRADPGVALSSGR